MYFGTQEFMDWIPCPAIDMPRPQRRWTVGGTFANGGGFVRRSAAGHREYDVSWNLMPASEIARIRAFFDGVHGQGPFYFIDPSAERTNVFPAAWAQPRLALDGGPTMVYDQVPFRESFTGPNRSYPSVGARYVLDSNSIANVLSLPVPPGYRLHFQAGVTSDGAHLAYRTGGGDWLTVDNATTYAITGDNWAEFSLQGTGAVNVFWMQGVVIPNHESPNFNQFHPGQGNSGVDYEDFEEHTHSVGVDLYGASARLREVGTWL